MKVSLIEPVGGHGGMNYYDMSLAKGLRSLEVDVDWYTCDRTKEESIQGIDVIKSFRRVYGDEPKFLRLFRFVVGLCRALIASRRRRVRIVHYHFFGFGALELIMCLLARLFLMRVCVTVHDVESFSSGRKRIVESAISRLVHHFIVHNRSSRYQLEKVLPPGFDTKNLTIIPHGNYLDYVRRRDKKVSRKRLDLNESGKILLFFGQIKAVKGLEILIEALPKVVSEQRSVTLVIAGKVWKDDFSCYQRLIEQRELINHVDLRIRYIPDEEVDDYYSSADIVVLPYKKIYQSGVLLMAMSYGLPVVASRLPGMEEVVTDRQTGYLFTSENSIDLAETLNVALADDEGREKIGSAALALMEDQYSWSEVARKTKKVYEELA